MNYEFHVGDYVERCNGSIGYLTVAKTWYSEAFCEDAVCLRGNTTVDASCGFTPFAMTIPLSDISKYFNRIGQYDFTKEKPDEIEFIDGVDTADPNDSPYIIDKINELISAVNELKEKIDG